MVYEDIISTESTESPSSSSPPPRPLLPPLIEACRQDNLAQVLELLSQGADPNVNADPVSEWTPLIYAKSAGVTRALLCHGADPTYATSYGYTAWKKAVYWNEAEIMQCIVEHHRRRLLPLPPSPPPSSSSSSSSK